MKELPKSLLKSVNGGDLRGEKHPTEGQLHNSEGGRTKYVGVGRRNGNYYGTVGVSHKF